jgi:acetolactate synthase regulatory subunit
MNSLTDESAKKPCAILVKMKNPLQTGAAILAILSERDIRVNTMHLHIVNADEGILIIHCMMENDRSRSMRHFLEKLKDVTELDLLQSRSSNLIKNTDTGSRI